MPEAQISDPRAAQRAGSVTYTSYVDADSNLLDLPRGVDFYRANGTIAQYDWVSLVPATATVPLSVEQMDNTNDAEDLAAALCLGVALHAAVAGEDVAVCYRGPTLCNIGDTTAAVGGLAIPHASTDGASGIVATASVATSTVGHFLGIYIGTEVGTSNTAPVFVRVMISSGIS